MVYQLYKTKSKFKNNSHPYNISGFQQKSLHTEKTSRFISKADRNWLSFLHANKSQSQVRLSSQEGWSALEACDKKILSDSPRWFVSERRAYQNQRPFADLVSESFCEPLQPTSFIFASRVLILWKLEYWILSTFLYCHGLVF